MPFDKSVFDKSEFIPAVRIPANKVGELLKSKSTCGYIWSVSGKKSVYPCPNDPKFYRILLLQSEFPADLRDMIECEDTHYSINWKYEDFNAEECLRKLIPDCVDPPSSFETIGHIAHMNLREEFMPYKNVVGEVILDKNPHIKVVVTKVGSLEGDFRTFKMEIVGSREGLTNPLIATVSENQMRLKIDFEKCYWNSRLSTERSRLLNKFKSTLPTPTRLIDMCCGVGALACFSARDGLEVFANDLNPDAVACLDENAARNSVDVVSFNMDGRDFVKKLVVDQKLPALTPVVNHVMINLPEIGIELLDVFDGLFDSPDNLAQNEFRIYCHCFSREKSALNEISARIDAVLPGIDPSNITLVHVRDVAPNKIMYSAEFTVPPSVVVNYSKKLRLE
jgi:tRNA (guanine37-N1)-methyltransferase